MLYGYPDSKVHGATVGPTWVLSAPDGPHVGPMNLAIWIAISIHVGHFGGYLHDPIQVNLWDYISIAEDIINRDMLLSVTDLYAIYGCFFRSDLTILITSMDWFPMGDASLPDNFCIVWWMDVWI